MNFIPDSGNNKAHVIQGSYTKGLQLQTRGGWRHVDKQFFQPITHNARCVYTKRLAS